MLCLNSYFLKAARSFTAAQQSKVALQHEEQWLAGVWVKKKLWWFVASSGTPLVFIGQIHHASWPANWTHAVCSLWDHSIGTRCVCSQIRSFLSGSFPPWEEENVPTEATVDSHPSGAPQERRDNLTILGPNGNHYVCAVPVRGRDWSHMTQTEWSLVKRQL